MENINSDKHIIQGLKCGDRAAFKMLYEKYNLILMRQLFTITNNREEAEEHLHETFITAVEKIAFYSNKDNGSFKAWLIRIATNKAIDGLRKNKREIEEERSELIPSTEGLSIKRENYIFLQGEIKRLPLLQRSSLSLRIIDDLSYMEISRILGVSMASIKQALFKGKKALKSNLENSEWCDERI